MSSRRIELVVTRTQVMMALLVLKNVKVPGAFLLTKVEKFVTTMLEKFPEDKFRILVEATDEKEDSDGKETKEVTQG